MKERSECSEISNEDTLWDRYGKLLFLVANICILTPKYDSTFFGDLSISHFSIRVAYKSHEKKVGKTWNLDDDTMWDGDLHPYFWMEFVQS